MKNHKDKIISAIFVRTHYIILIAFAVLLWFNTKTEYAVTLSLLFALYVIAFEIYLHRKEILNKRNAEKIINLLEYPANKKTEKFPLPIAVSDSEDNILWINDLLFDLLGETNIKSLSKISDISENISQTDFTEAEAFDKKFDVYTSISADNDDLKIHYFIDTTQRHLLEDKYDNMRPAVARILIDNYDELFSNTGDAEKNIALAKLYEAIREFASKTNGLLLRTERDMFTFIIDNAELKSEENNRFTILEDIKKLDLNLKTYPTLSIGIGFGNDDYVKNDELARQAIDSALSRGGDQAVIKTDKDIRFYGGTSENSDRKAGTKARVIASALEELFKNCSDVIIMGHRYSDFDSLGASIGFYRFAVSHGKKAYIIFDQDSNMAENLYNQFRLSGEYEDVFISPDDAIKLADQNSMAVILDNHRPSTALCYDIIGKTKYCILVDHHRRHPDHITCADIFFHDPSASSACEMITEIIKYAHNTELTKLEAEALLAGIILDTKSFTLRTSPSTFEAAFFLKKVGANTVNVKMLFKTDMGIHSEKIKFMSFAYLYRDMVSIAVWPETVENVSTMKLISSQVADDMLNVNNVHASFTIFQDNIGTVYISARSLGVINVQLIMEELNGGGHQTMAAAQMTTTMEEAAIMLKHSIDNYLNAINVKKTF